MAANVIIPRAQRAALGSLRQIRWTPAGGIVQNCARISRIMPFWNDSLDPAAAQHQVGIVEDCGLSGRHGTLRLVETHLDARGVYGGT
jgi:hypothetical protein